MVVLLHCTYKEIHSNTLAATTEINTSKNTLALDVPLFKIKHVHASFFKQFPLLQFL